LVYALVRRVARSREFRGCFAANPASHWFNFGVLGLGLIALYMYLCHHPKKKTPQGSSTISTATTNSWH
jgi:hypothetical protein